MENNSAIKYNILMLKMYVCLLLENAYSFYNKGQAFGIDQMLEKTNYRISYNVEKMKKIIEKENCYDLIFLLENIVKSFVNLQNQNELKEIDIFEKEKKKIIFSILIEYCFNLIKMFQDLILYKKAINFCKLEENIKKNLNVLYFQYVYLVKQINPEIKIKKLSLTKTKKNLKKKKYKIFKKNLMFMFYIIIFIFICLFFIMYKIYDLIFYLKLKVANENFFLDDTIQLFTKNIFYSFLTLCFIIFITIIVEKFFKKKSINSLKVLYDENKCLKKNMLVYHKIIYSFIFISKNKSMVEDFSMQIKKKLLTNFENLYLILSENETRILSYHLKNRICFLEKLLEKEQTSFEKLIYKTEIIYCNEIKNFLQKKTTKVVFFENLFKIFDYMLKELLILLEKKNYEKK